MMRKNPLLTIDYWVLLFSITLIRFPLALGYNNSATWRLAFMLPIIFVAAKNFLLLIRNGGFYFRKNILLLIMLFYSFMIVAFLRTAISGKFETSAVLGNLLTWALMLFFGVTLFATIDRKYERIYQMGVVVSIFLYVIINVSAYGLGFQSPQIIYTRPFVSVMLGFFHVTAYRVIFLTANGLVNFGVVAGMSLAMSLIVFFYEKKFTAKFFAGVVAAVSLYAVLLTDSRTVLFLSVISVCIILILPAIYQSYLKFLPIITPLLPVLAVIVISFLPNTIGGVSLARSNSDLASLSNRTVIWKTVLEMLSKFELQHLWGFGYRGQIISGVSFSYSYLFSSYVRDTTASAHNILLQYILDVGYIGTIVLIFLLVLLISNLVVSFKKDTRNYTPLIFLCVIVYLLLVGTTDAVLSPDFQEVFLVFVLITAFISVAPKSYSAHNIAYSHTMPGQLR